MAKNMIEFNFIGEPSEKLMCLVCLDVAKEPKQHDKCGKIFCSECIERIKDKPCPACKTDKPNYFTDTRAAQEIRDLAINCKNSSAGCLWKGTVATLPDHVTSCECEVVLCKYNYVGCDVKKMKMDMKRHEEEDDKHHLHLALQSVAIPTLSHGDKFVFKITDYSVKKRNNEVFTSDPFYTHTNGYKMCVKVYLNGTGSGAGTHVSVTTCLLQGPFDRNLKWPFQWGIRIEIVNQNRECINNFYQLFKHNVDCGGCCNIQQYVPHSLLSEDPTLLMNDTMYFRVGVETRKGLHWLECGIQTHMKLMNACKIFADQKPIVFNIPDFSIKRKLGYQINSRFYTSSNGYLINIGIDLDGDGSGKGTHISVFTYIIEGAYDDILSWPFIGTVKIELLNQKADENHHSETLVFTQSDNMVVGENRGYPEFVRHDELQGYDQQYLIDDTLYFRVSVSVGTKQHKPWLVCTD